MLLRCLVLVLLTIVSTCLHIPAKSCRLTKWCSSCVTVVAVANADTAAVAAAIAVAVALAAAVGELTCWCSCLCWRPRQTA